MVGPHETMSIPGNLEAMTAHSRPAWITFNAGSFPKVLVYMSLHRFNSGEEGSGCHGG